MSPRPATVADALAGLTLEDHVTAPALGGLTSASPLQRAICRAADGLPIGDLLGPEERARFFGVAELPPTRPTIVALVCGVRGGKTRLAVHAAIRGALTCDAASIPPHETPRFALIGPFTDAADATFAQLRGVIHGSAVYRRFIAKETANAITLKRPDGRQVEIVVVAANKAGLSVRNRWLAGAIFEEAASFGEESQGAAVNLEELERAAITRLLPRAQLWFIGSPFGPRGRMHEIWTARFGKPDGRTIVCWAPTRALNPSFPQATIDAVRAEQPDVAAREFDAQWIDADSAFYESVLVDGARRIEPLIRHRIGPRDCVAAMDPATRGNDWTLAVAWQDGRTVIAGVWRWQGSKQAPLSPRAVLAEVARLLEAYGSPQVYADGWAFDALQDHATAAGLRLVEHPNKDRDLPYVRLKAQLQNGLIELPPDPLLRQDLLAVRQRATSNGVKIILPKTTDGRHCDFAPAVALAATYSEGAPNQPAPLSSYLADGPDDHAARNEFFAAHVAKLHGTYGEHFGTGEAINRQPHPKSQAEIDAERRELSRELWERAGWPF